MQEHPIGKDQHPTSTSETVFLYIFGKSTIQSLILEWEFLYILFCRPDNHGVYTLYATLKHHFQRWLMPKVYLKTVESEPNWNKLRVNFSNILREPSLIPLLIKVKPGIRYFIKSSLIIR